MLLSLEIECNHHTEWGEGANAFKSSLTFRVEYLLVFNRGKENKKKLWKSYRICDCRFSNVITITVKIIKIYVKWHSTQILSTYLTTTR